MIFVVVPLVAPALLVAAPDAPWVSVLTLLILQASFLIPPFGYAVLMARSRTGRRVRTAALARALLPFVAAQLAVLTRWRSRPASCGAKLPCRPPRSSPFPMMRYARCSTSSSGARAEQKLKGPPKRAFEDWMTLFDVLDRVHEVVVALLGHAEPQELVLAELHHALVDLLEGRALLRSLV